MRYIIRSYLRFISDLAMRILLATRDDLILAQFAHILYIQGASRTAMIVNEIFGGRSGEIAAFKRLPVIS